MPSPRKPEAELDPTPLLWARTGTHPPLALASREPTTAPAIAKRRETARRARAAEGKSERKFQDVDLWPVVVSEQIQPDSKAADKVIEYAKKWGGQVMVNFCFQHEARLQDLVRRCWRFEKVEECVRQNAKSRMQLLKDAGEGACVCSGKWKPAACDLFQRNGLSATKWCKAVLHSMEHGRGEKGSLVCHVGVEGDEGKSFLWGPLPEVFGEDKIFTPVKSSFPLMGLEDCRVALLDDWRFGEDILPYNVQLLWFEGKPVVIARPQNQATGHLRYRSDDPIFISTLEASLEEVPKTLQPGDVAMMKKRLTVFRFVTKLQNPDKTIKACGRCFVDFLHQNVQAFHGKPASARPHSVAPSVQKRGATGPTGATPEKKVPKTWTVADVVVWLDSLSLGHLAERFRDNGVDGEFLSDLSLVELESGLGLTPLQAKKVLSRFKEAPN